MYIYIYTMFTKHIILRSLWNLGFSLRYFHVTKKLNKGFDMSIDAIPLNFKSTEVAPFLVSKSMEEWNGHHIYESFP